MTEAIKLGGPMAERHRVRVYGAGAPVTVLSHGLGTDQGVWEQVIGGLQGCGTLITYDLPGAGPLLPQDFDPRRYQSLDGYSDDLLALLTELRVARCVYVGHSVSGMIGALAAVEAPDLFQRLVLLNASPRYLNEGDYVGGFARSDLDGLYAAMRDNYEGWVAGFAPMAIGAEMPSAVATFSGSFLRMRPDVTSSVARTIFESDLRAIVPQVQTPVTLIHSRADIAVPREVALYMLEHFPDAELLWVDADGHLPHLTAAPAVTELLRPILVEAGRSGRDGP